MESDGTEAIEMPVDTVDNTIVVGVTRDDAVVPVWTDGNLDSNAEAISIVEGSKSNFSKIYQIRGDKVRRLQHADAFTSDQTLTCSVVTNGMRNNPISRRDIDVCNKILGKSKYLN